MRIFSASRTDVTEVLEIGSGLTLEQNTDGVPRITGGLGSVSAAVEFVSTDLDGPVYDLPSSDGVRLMLWPHDIGAADAGHAIGVETGALWYGVGGVANAHKWYGGEDQWMQLSIEVGTNPRLKIGTLNPSNVPLDSNILTLSAKASTSDGSDMHIVGFFYGEQSASTAHSIQGVEGYVRATHTSGTVTTLIGTIGNAELDGSGGTVTKATGVGGGVIISAGTITEGHCARFASASLGGGTITTLYGVYIAAQTIGGTNYQLYSEGTAKSYFAGAVLIGQDSNPNSASFRVRHTAASTAIELDVNAGTPGLYAVSMGGGLRWRWGADGATESGSNAGNDFILSRYSDAGSFLGTVLTVVRSSGAATFAGTLAWGGGSAISSSASVVQTSRTLTASTGLTGGGDLSANRSFAIDTSIVPRKNVSESISGSWSFSASVVASVTPGFITDTGSGVAALFRAARSGAPRWQFGSDGASEGGSDTGSNFVLFAYTDGGSFSLTAMQVARTGNDPVSIRVGGALKQLTIDGSGFIKGV